MVWVAKLLLLTAVVLQVWGIRRTICDLVRSSDEGAIELVTIPPLMLVLLGGCVPGPRSKTIHATVRAVLSPAEASAHADALTPAAPSLEDRVTRLEAGLKDLSTAQEIVREEQRNLRSEVRQVQQRGEAEHAETRRQLREELRKAAVAQIRMNLVGPQRIVVGLVLGFTGALLHP